MELIATPVFALARNDRVDLVEVSYSNVSASTVRCVAVSPF